MYQTSLTFSVILHLCCYFKRHPVVKYFSAIARCDTHHILCQLQTQALTQKRKGNYGPTTILLLVPELGPKVGKKSLRPLDKHQCEKNKRHEQKHAYITKSNISARVKNKRDTRIHNQVQYIRLFFGFPPTDG